jgi:hypothetical protein
VRVTAHTLERGNVQEPEENKRPRTSKETSVPEAETGRFSSATVEAKGRQRLAGEGRTGSDADGENFRALGVRMGSKLQAVDQLGTGHETCRAKEKVDMQED